MYTGIYRDANMTSWSSYSFLIMIWVETSQKNRSPSPRWEALLIPPRVAKVLQMLSQCQWPLAVISHKCASSNLIYPLPKDAKSTLQTFWYVLIYGNRRKHWITYTYPTLPSWKNLRDADSFQPSPKKHMNFYELIEYNWFTGYIPMEHYRYVFQEHRET